MAGVMLTHIIELMIYSPVQILMKVPNLMIFEFLLRHSSENA